jgi:phage terminase large subunit-like protein
VSLDFHATWSSLRRRWETHDGAYYFDPEKAKRAEDFFPGYLRHHLGDFNGKTFTLRADQRFLIVRPLFGWRRKSDGMRRFRKLFAFCPKGWGKSPLGAALGIYLARCDGENASEVYAVAADREQARIVHTNAKIMVENSPRLMQGCEIVKNAITWPEDYASYTVLSSDSSTKHGFRPHGVIFDELHAQPNRDLFETLRKSMVKRVQPLLVIITHAGTDDEGICYEEYDLAKRVLQGEVDLETTLPVIFEAHPNEDWTDHHVWERVNPGHGETVQHDAIVQECQEARAEPRKRNDFLRYHLNVWTNQATSWIPIDWWDACTADLPSDEELAKYPAAIGLDMAQKIDLASAVAAFRLPLQGQAEDSVEVVSVDEAGGISKRRVSMGYRIALVPAFWLPEDTLRERVAQDLVPYDLWSRDGLLKVTEGTVIDSDAIVQYLLSLLTRFPLLKQGEVGYDPAFATELSIRLRNAGLKTVEVLQNYKHLSEACQVFEALVKAKRVIHGGHRLLRWNVENVAVKTDDAGRVRPVKPKRAAKRIDGVVASIMALSRLMVMPEPKRKTYAAVMG